jgi:glucose-1-phosphatase
MKKLKRKKQNNMKPVRYLVLDLGNVIVDVNYQRFCKKINIDTEAFQSFYEQSFFRLFEIGDKNRDDYFFELQKHVGFPVHRRHEFEKLIHTAFPLRLRTWGLIHHLKRHIPVFLLSNTNVVDFENIDAYVGLREAFHNVYLSYEQGRSKPAPETYHHAAEFLGVNPEETLFCDDRKDNIEGVREAGWQGYQVGDESEFINYLTKRLLLDSGAFK